MNSQDPTPSQTSSIQTSNLEVSSLAQSKHRTICPIGMRILVRTKKDENEIANEVCVFSQNSDESILGKVLEVASVSENGSDEETNISGIPQGATILISINAGIKLPWDKDLRLVETREVLAIVDEIILD